MTKWAILIGVDFYGEYTDDLDEFDRLWNLDGCVHDVENIKQVLAQNWGFQDEYITTLVSRHTDASPTEKTVVESLASVQIKGDSATGQTAEQEHDASASYENIVKSITSVLKNSLPGDLIYVHFSGYVYRVPTATPDARKRLDRDHDLALLSANLLSDGRCLYDVELAILLRKLTLKGCEVTLVVDGRGTLADVPQLTSLRPPKTPREDALPVVYGAQALGKHIWLLNPPPDSRYTVFMTAGFTVQATGENEWIDPETGASCGFLTYRMLRLLKQKRPHETYKSFARQLTVEAEPWIARYLSRSGDPSLLIAGAENRLFLGAEQQLTVVSTTFPARIIEEQGIYRLRLEGGTAHGLKKGSQVVLVDGLGATEADGLALGLFDVTSVYGLFSLSDHLPPFWESLSANQSLRAILTMDGHNIALPRVDETTSTGHLGLDDARDIAAQLSTSQKIFELGSLSLSPETRASLYRSLIELKNEPNAISRHTRVSVLGGYGHTYTGAPRIPTWGDNGHLHLLSGDYVVIHLVSTLPHPAFVRVLCFDSAFGIEQVYPNTCGPDPELPSPGVGFRSEVVLRVRLALPLQLEPLSTSHATELLKIYVMDSPSSFEALDMPPINEETFLREHQDPASNITSAPGGSPGGNGAMGYRRVFHGDDGEGTASNLSDSWCCFETRFVVHRSTATMPPPNSV